MTKTMPAATEDPVLWQGCPAPRAFTFRRWRWSVASLPALAGLLFLAPTATSEIPSTVFCCWLLALLATGYGCLGHLFQARLEWSGVRYVLVGSRLQVSRGWPLRRREELLLHDLAGWRVLPVAGQVVSLRLQRRAVARPMHLLCLERPHGLLRHLQDVLPAGTDKNIDTAPGP
jgi:hypothetical protein